MVTSESMLLMVGFTKSVVVTTISGMKNNLAGMAIMLGESN